MQKQPELVRGGFRAGGPIGGKVRLPRLDVVLRRAAPESPASRLTATLPSPSRINLPLAAERIRSSRPAGPGRRGFFAERQLAQAGPVMALRLKFAMSMAGMAAVCPGCTPIHLGNPGSEPVIAARRQRADRRSNIGKNRATDREPSSLARIEPPVRSVPLARGARGAAFGINPCMRKCCSQHGFVRARAPALMQLAPVIVWMVRVRKARELERPASNGEAVIARDPHLARVEDAHAKQLAVILVREGQVVRHSTARLSPWR